MVSIIRLCQFVRLSQVKTEVIVLGMVVKEQASKQHKAALMNDIGKCPTYSSFGCK